MGVAARAGQAGFAAATLLALSVCFALCAAGRALLRSDRRRSQRWACAVCHWCFRALILAPCPWIRVRSPPDATWRELLGREKVFLLMNHTSFLDAIIFVAMCPPDVLWRYRTLMKASLFKVRCRAACLTAQVLEAYCRMPIA